MCSEKEYPIISGVACLGEIFSKQRKLEAVLNKKGGEPCANEQRYIIPFFQRPYQWNWNNEQLMGLYKTIVNLPSEDSIEETKVIKDDYVIFGNIQLNETEEGYEIIDGQQRLTSFWLFLKAIESVGKLKATEGVEFELYNYISGELNEQFKNYASGGDNAYAINYEKLKTQLANDTEILHEWKLSFSMVNLRKYLLEKVLFSVMITSYKDDIQKSITLFDSLNTKGLDLQVKDVFKIKYYSYIKLVDPEKNAEEIFKKINSSYDKCKDGLDKMYQIGVEDYLDTFKLWIVLNDPDGEKQKNLAKKIKASPNAFFNDDKYTEFQTPDKSSSKGLDSFSGIAKTIYETQRIISELDAIGPNEQTDAALLCTYELLRKCGYWYFRNILFALCHAVRIKKDSRRLDKSDVIGVLKTCRIIWRICAIIKVRDLRVVDDVLTSIPKCLIQFINGSITSIDERLKEFFVDSDKEWRKEYYFPKFIETLTGKTENENIYENRMGRFFVELLYLKDCNEYLGEYSWKEQKEKLYYTDNKERKNQKYEVEHIASQHFGPIIGDIKHHIGNLILLSADINKSLGEQTRNKNGENEEDFKEDFSNKISPLASEKDRAKYRKDIIGEKRINVSIKRFLEKTAEADSFNKDSIIEMIEERNKESLKSIQEELADLGVDLDSKKIERR